MAFRGLANVARSRASQFRGSQHLFGSCRSYSRVILNAQTINNGGIFPSQHESQHAPLLTRSLATSFLHAKTNELSIVPHGARTMTIQAKLPAHSRQMAAMQVTMLSPGFVYEPYTVRESIPFWRRWFTRSGWKRTKADVILEIKNAYAIAKLRKSGYSKQKFYTEAVELYKEINFLLVHGDKKKLRKKVSDRMYSTLKNDIKQREFMWSKVYWEMLEPVVKIRTLRARLIAVDRNDTNKVFAQLTIEFLTKQKFEAYDSKGTVVAGDKRREALVKDIWVFEKSLFHSGAYWRLCGKIFV